MKSIDVNDHQLFARIVDFSHKLATRTTKGHPASEDVISSEFPKLMNSQSLTDYVKSALDMVQADSLSSLPMRTAVAKAIVSTNVGSKAQAISLILDSKLNARCVTVETCRDALKFIESLGKDGVSGRDQLMTQIMTKFPFAKDFD